MTTEYEVKQVFEVNYDEGSPEFQEALEGYRECINSDADAKDMVKAAVWHIAKYGNNNMIEGIGYVKYNGLLFPRQLPYSGIEVTESYEDVEEI